MTYRGPLTKCLEEDDEILYDADKYVPNDTTIRIKVYLQNKKPLFVIVKKDATVQDTIEMTIRKSNALAAAFQKTYQERKEAAEKSLHEKEKVKSPEAHSPPLEDVPLSPPHNGIHDGIHDGISDGMEGLNEFLDAERFESRYGDRGSRKEECVPTIRVDDIKGVEAMTLLTDSMAYELRMAVGDGECDMDFPGRSGGGV